MGATLAQTNVLEEGFAPVSGERPDYFRLVECAEEVLEAAFAFSSALGAYEQKLGLFGMRGEEETNKAMSLTRQGLQIVRNALEQRRVFEDI